MRRLMAVIPQSWLTKSVMGQLKNRALNAPSFQHEFQSHPPLINDTEWNLYGLVSWQAFNKTIPGSTSSAILFNHYSYNNVAVSIRFHPHSILSMVLEWLPPFLQRVPYCISFFPDVSTLSEKPRFLLRNPKPILAQSAHLGFLTDLVLKAIPELGN